jgi:hypothetical protein
MSDSSLPAVPLADLAERINAEHEQAVAALRSGLEHARTAGELLLQAKGQLTHGGWLPWLKEHCTVSTRTAQLYMRVAKRWPELEEGASNAQGLAHLTLEDADRLLASPRPEKSATVAHLTRAVAGDTDGRMMPVDQLSLHPAISMVPMMRPHEYAGFLANIRKYGILVPLELEPGTTTILDGRCRWLAAKEAGIKEVPVVDAALGDGEDPALYVLRGATMRAHYSDDQIAAAFVKAEAYRAAHAQEEG